VIARPNIFSTYGELGREFQSTMRATIRLRLTTHSSKFSIFISAIGCESTSNNMELDRILVNIFLFIFLFFFFSFLLRGNRVQKSFRCHGVYFDSGDRTRDAALRRSQDSYAVVLPTWRAMIFDVSCELDKWSQRLGRVGHNDTCHMHVSEHETTPAWW